MYANLHPNYQNSLEVKIRCKHILDSFMGYRAGVINS